MKGDVRRSDAGEWTTMPILERSTAVMRIPRQWRSLAKAFITLVVAVLLVWIVDVRAATRVLLAVDPVWFGAALAVAVADRLLMVGKWYPLLRVQAPTIRPSHAVRAYLAAGAAGFVLPASVGGDVLRAMALGKRDGATVEIGVSIATERFLGMPGSMVVVVGSVVVAIVATPLELGILLPWALGALGAAIAVGGLALSDRVSRRIRARRSNREESGRWMRACRRIEAAFRCYRRRPVMLVAVGLLSVVEQTFPVLVFWILSLGLGGPANLVALFVAVPVTTFAARIPITVAGLGIVEGGLVYLLARFGVPGEQALALGLAGRVVNVATTVPGVLFWRGLLTDPRRARRRVIEARHARSS